MVMMWSWTYETMADLLEKWVLLLVQEFIRRLSCASSSDVHKKKAPTRQTGVLRNKTAAWLILGTFLSFAVNAFQFLTQDFNPKMTQKSGAPHGHPSVVNEQPIHHSKLTALSSLWHGQVRQTTKQGGRRENSLLCPSIFSHLKFSQRSLPLGSSSPPHLLRILKKQGENKFSSLIFGLELLFFQIPGSF